MMERCAIERADGVVRISVLCPSCASTAVTKLIEAERRFWSRPYDGPESCEACYYQPSAAALSE